MAFGDDSRPRLQILLDGYAVKTQNAGRGFGDRDGDNDGDWNEPIGTFSRLLEVLLRSGGDAKKTERLLDAWREQDLLSPNEFAACDRDELLNSALLANVKLTPARLGLLLKFTAWVCRACGPDAGAGAGADALGVSVATRLADWETEDLRDQWRSLSGIGAALSDQLLLYGLGRPVIPMDRAGYRVMVRHGWLEPDASEDDARETFQQLAVIDDDEDVTPDSAAAHGRDDALAHSFVCAHRIAALSAIAAKYCKVAGPRCRDCPLQPLLPACGPYSPDS